MGCSLAGEASLRVPHCFQKGTPFIPELSPGAADEQLPSTDLFALFGWRWWWGADGGVPPAEQGL
nr:unnamed protein product [Digitaria exilis]